MQNQALNDLGIKGSFTSCTLNWRVIAMLWCRVGSAVLQGCLAAWPWWWPTSWRWRAEAGWSLWPPWGRRGPAPDRTWASCGSWRSLRTQNWQRWAVKRWHFWSRISANDATSKVTDWTMTQPGSGFGSFGFTSTGNTSRYSGIFVNNVEIVCHVEIAKQVNYQITELTNVALAHWLVAVFNSIRTTQIK